MGEQLLSKYDELINSINEEFPKVDPELLLGVLARLRDDPESLPRYTLEIFAEKGADKRKIEKTITKETGTVPTVYDETHYVSEHDVSLDLLRKLSDIDDIQHITGQPLDFAYSTGVLFPNRRVESIKPSEKSNQAC